MRDIRKLFLIIIFTLIVATIFALPVEIIFYKVENSLLTSQEKGSNTFQIARYINIPPTPLAKGGNFMDASISFGEIEINQSQSIELLIENTYHKEQIIRVSSFLSNITLSDSLFYIMPQESVSMKIDFIGKTNIHYQTAIVFENQFNHSPIYLPLSAICFLPDDEYPTTFNLFDNELKNELFILINNHTPMSYNNAREVMFSSIDNFDGFVECVYTGILVETDGIPDGSIMNAEHAWPQSMGATGIARADLHILFPCNSTANNMRSNLQYREVIGIPNWENGGSKRGFGNQGLLIFEPRDARKGDLSRALFYFAVKYENPFSPFFDNQEPILREWNRNFEVTEREINRNIAIGELQGIVNPFVIHPAFADRIYSISSNATEPERIELIYPEIVFYEDIGLLKIPLFNNGNREISINNVVKSSQDLQVLNYPQKLDKSEVGYIELIVIQSFEDFYDIAIYTDKGIFNITLKEQTINIFDSVLALSDFYIYPNPVRGEINVVFKNNDFSPRKMTELEKNLSIYNIRGQRVYTQLITDFNTQVTMPENLSSGIYFLKIQNDSNTAVKKLLYLK